MLTAFQLDTQHLEIAIVENEKMTAKGLKQALLDLGCNVLWTARNEKEAQENILASEPRIIIVDLGLDDSVHDPTIGWELIQEFNKMYPHMGIIIHSRAPVEESIAFDAIRLGCSYIIKEDVKNDVIMFSAAILAILSNGVFISNGVRHSIHERINTQRQIDELTEREWEVLELLAAGKQRKEIAAKLFIDPTTVSSHLASIYSKIGVRNMTEAVNWYWRNHRLRS